jgi:hypothetical protein
MTDFPSPAKKEERRFTLPCGCVAVTNDDVFQVHWCPHHTMLHGVLPCDFAKDSRAEQRVYHEPPLQPA